MRAAVSLLAAGGVSLTAACGGPPEIPPLPTPAPESPPAVAIPPGQPNGVERLQPGEILDRAVVASRAATSVRVKGRCCSGADLFDLDMVYVPTGATGERRLRDQTVEVTRIGPDGYIRAGDQFWRNIRLRAYRDKYLRFDAADARFAGVMELTTLERLLAGMLPKGGAQLRRARERAINGLSAVELVDRVSESSVWVATKGSPYVLRVAGRGGQLDFLNYDAKFVLEPPGSGPQVVRLQ